MAELAAFIGVSALVIVLPGQDTAPAIRNTLLGVPVAFSALTLAWLAAYAFAVARAGALLRRARVRHALEAVTGTVPVAFGLRPAAER